VAEKWVGGEKKVMVRREKKVMSEEGGG